eukprot:GILK01001759.1.p1 GENE.GILK01001759.1~~GILK01001759.1.p1  ORF type:complete len:507 (-),score=65.08 GILK01001759.1:239-1708(-)
MASSSCSFVCVVLLACLVSSAWHAEAKVGRHYNDHVGETKSKIFHSIAKEVESTFDLNENTLLITQLIFRHGDRAPLDLLPLPYIWDALETQDWKCSPYKDEQFDAVGILDNCRLSNLTVLGERQLYERGHELAGFYKNLVASISVEDIYLRSTNVDRTERSLQQLLHGMFADRTESFQQSVQALPVHERATKELETMWPCEKYYQLRGPALRVYARARAADSQAVAKEMELKRKFIAKFIEGCTQYLYNVAGVQDIWKPYNGKIQHFCKTVIGIDNVIPESYDVEAILKKFPRWGDIYDVLTGFMSHSTDRTLSAFGLDRADYQAVSHEIMQQMKFLLSDPILIRWSSGDFLNDLYLVFKRHLLSSSKKMFFYSGHDITLNPLLAAFGMFREWTPYGGFAAVELHKVGADSDLYVRVLYNDVADPNNGRIFTWKEFQMLCEESFPATNRDQCNLLNEIPPSTGAAGSAGARPITPELASIPARKVGGD